MQGTDAAQPPASDRGWRLFLNGSALLKRARSQRFFMQLDFQKHVTTDYRRKVLRETIPESL